MEADYCNGIKTDGTPCRSKALVDGSYCISHSPDPTWRKIQKDGAILGGKSAKNIDLKLNKGFRVKGINDYRTFIEKVISVAAVNGIQLNPASLSAVSRLGDVYMKVLDKAQIEQDIKTIKEQMNSR